VRFAAVSLPFRRVSRTIHRGESGALPRWVGRFAYRARPTRTRVRRNGQLTAV